jgi:hypothetical protein
MLLNRISLSDPSQASKFVVAIALLIAGVNLAGLQLLLSRGEVSRIIQIRNMNDPSVGDLPPRGSAAEQKAFLKLLRDAGLDKLRGEKQVLALMQWVMNSVRKIEPEAHGSPYKILMESRLRGHGMVCSGMAYVFQEGLALLGVQSRIVVLKSNLFGASDSHVTVEAMVNGRWRIYDPTFHVSFRKDGALLSAQELHDLLQTNSKSRIVPVFYGPVAYPARIESYYMDYVPLFNYVLIYKQWSNAFWDKLPPLHFFYGSQLFF